MRSSGIGVAFNRSEPDHIELRNRSADHCLFEKGRMTLEVTGFWEGTQGSISHVSILSSQPVPEPATMLLLGSGLTGIAGFGRKKVLKK